MNIRKRMKAVFINPKRELNALKPDLEKLRWDLQQALDSDDPLSEIVHFFDSVSKWQDRGIDDIVRAFEAVNYGQYDEVLEKLRTLQVHFTNAGRCEYGWNRTSLNEIVTADKVFLGGIFGLWTKTITCWKEHRNDAKGAWKGSMWDGHPSVEGKSIYEIVSQQAREIMSSNAEPMITIIEDIRATA